MDIDDDQEEDIIYVVDDLADSRRTKGEVQQRIRWEGYKEHDDTWQRFEDLWQGTYQALTDFHQTNPWKPAIKE